MKKVFIKKLCQEWESQFCDSAREPSIDELGERATLSDPLAEAFKSKENLQ